MENSMDLNALASRIARELLEHLRHSEDTSPCVLVLAQRDETLAAKVAALIGEGVRIQFSGEDCGKQRPCRHILPRLDCAAMADLAVGRASDDHSREVLRLLLSGIAVEALEFEYKTYAETAPGPLYALYASYEKTLAGYGLTEFKCTLPRSARLQDTLVTAHTITEADKAGLSTLVIAPGALVTPAAADAAKELNIIIEKRI